MKDFKNIHIGSLIKNRVEECDIQTSRICNFFKCTENEVEKMYQAKSIETENLLGWCKLLEYDFFRFYSQHLILFSPKSSKMDEVTSKSKTNLPAFRKNIYTREIIDFILESIENGDKTKNQVIEDYKIPKTTLYRWIEKYTK